MIRNRGRRIEREREREEERERERDRDRNRESRTQTKTDQRGGEALETLSNAYEQGSNIVLYFGAGQI